jgi:leucyl/phenylalanyl-tRNA--protein transferase
VLNADDLIEAYSLGYFPMAHAELNYEIRWHRPLMRGIVPLNERFHIPNTLRRFLAKNPFTYTLNTQFKAVMEQCAIDRKDGTWITTELIDAYCELHQRGCATSIEAWKDDQLVGGLYGVNLGKAFFGESMFHRSSNASKACLVFLVDYLRSLHFKLLDSQYLNPHLTQFGAYEMPDEEYMRLLKKALPRNYSPQFLNE